jgi:hypothetical protein
MVFVSLNVKDFVGRNCSADVAACLTVHVGAEATDLMDL